MRIFYRYFFTKTGLILARKWRKSAVLKGYQTQSASKLLFTLLILGHFQEKTRKIAKKSVKLRKF